MQKNVYIKYCILHIFCIEYYVKASIYFLLQHRPQFKIDIAFQKRCQNKFAKRCSKIDDSDRANLIFK